MGDFVVTHEVTFRFQDVQGWGGFNSMLGRVFVPWLTERGGSILAQSPETQVGPMTWDVTLLVSLPVVSGTLAGALTDGATRYAAFPPGVSVRALVQGATRRADILALGGGAAAIG